MTIPAFVYEGSDGELVIEEGGFSSRGFYDDNLNADVVELAALHFWSEMPSGHDDDDVKLGRFRVTIEKL